MFLRTPPPETPSRPLAVLLAWVALILVAWLASPTGHASEQSREEKRVQFDEGSPQVLTALPAADDEIDLDEAIALTLRIDPEVQSRRQELARALAQEQTADGAFDAVLQVQPTYSYDRHENFPFLLARERKTRTVLRALASAYGSLSESLAEALSDDRIELPRCPEDLDVEDTSLLESRDQTQFSGLGFGEVSIQLGGLEDEVEGVFDICVPRDSTGSTPSDRRDLFSSIDAIAGLGLQDVFDDVQAIQRGRLSLMQEIAEAVARKSSLSLARIGTVPEDEISKVFSLQAAYVKPFKNGIRMDFELSLDSTERNFRGKSLDPTFGGMGIRNRFNSSAALSLNFPLGKGRGRVSTMAPLRAASENVTAQREFLRHTMMQEAFGTLIAFIDVLSERDRTRLLEESAERQRRLVEIAQDLAGAGDVARSEVARARARAASVEGALAAARVSLTRARFALANAIGLEVSRPQQAPGGRGELRRDGQAPPSVGDLIEEGLRRRRDRQALGSVRDAQQVLANAASADIKRQIDLSIRLGMGSFWESPFFRHLPSELDDPPAEEHPLRFDEPAGYWRSFEDEWKPFITVGLSVDLPIQNRTARGRYLQRSASLRQSEIEWSDLSRRIRDRVVSARGAVVEALDSLEQHSLSVDRFERTLNSAMERFEAGDISLIDTLTSEEDLTRARLELVTARQRYLGLRARLAFETGTILEFNGASGNAPGAFFDASAYVAER
jgi:outer membrane protein TolC